MEFKTNNFEETVNLGKKLVLDFLESEQHRKSALVIVLEGDLGAGKTTITQGFAQALGVESWIKSPTFVLMREHKISPEYEVRSSKYEEKNSKPNRLTTLIHIDCYRVDNPDALIEIGIKDILADPQNIVFIEWGEKIAKLLPKNIIRIKIKHLKEDQRKITIN
ncbi:MAG: tRNA (adenosine(37)-N6)-threonylcarbamoyltransferase complex ATPase subunit type 1 TsaE [Candidatus Paceibacterota bacterium]|jgi:tRNA threonylcarbamoyladenosine biosynthesis protein TsaE